RRPHAGVGAARTDARTRRRAIAALHLRSRRAAAEYQGRWRDPHTDGRRGRSGNRGSIPSRLITHTATAAFDPGSATGWLFRHHVLSYRPDFRRYSSPTRG